VAADPSGDPAARRELTTVADTRAVRLDLGSSDVVIEVVDHPGDSLALEDGASLIQHIRFGS